jgi:hypothetical protein
MANIDSALRLDKDLTNLAIGFKQGLEPGLAKLAPVIDKASNGQYPSYGRDAFYYNKETQRERGADAHEYEQPTETWNAYKIEEHTLVGKVDRRDMAKSRIRGMPYSDEAKLSQTVLTALTQAQHYKTVSTIFNTTNLSGCYATPDPQWNAAGAAPWDDMQTWWMAFKNNCGVSPNIFAIDSRSLSYLGELVRAKYSATTGRSNKALILEALMPDFGITVDHFVILDADYYSSSAFTSLTGDNCLFAYNPASFGDWMPGLAATIVPNDSVTTRKGVGVKTPYWNEDETARKVQVSLEYKIVLLSKYAGYMGYDLLA